MPRGKVYALAHGQYVELRRAMKPPVATVSKLMKPAPLDVWGNSLGPAHSYTICSFDGGAVLANVPNRRFRTLTGHALSTGTAWEMTPELATSILEKLNA